MAARGDMVVLRGRSDSQSSCDSTTCLLNEHTPQTRDWKRTRLIALAVLTIAAFGIMVALSCVAFAIKTPSCPRPRTSSTLDAIIQTWTRPGDGLDVIKSTPPGEITRGIIPIPCHSHNDHWRKVPFFEALAAGCTSVEVDIWPPSPGDTSSGPLVAHTRSSTHASHTLQTLYLEPIFAFLSHQQQNQVQNTITSSSSASSALRPSIFPSNRDASLVLLLDFKTPDASLWSAVQTALQHFRDNDWLTYYDPSLARRVTRAVTIVASGAVPFDHITNLTTERPVTKQDVFYDAPLEALSSGKYGVENSYYASASLAKTVGNVGWGFRPDQQRKLQRLVKGAGERGLLARLWDAPRGPVSRRDAVWRALLRMGVGVLNGDDVECMAGMLGERWMWNLA